MQIFKVEVVHEGDFLPDKNDAGIDQRSSRDLPQEICASFGCEVICVLARAWIGKEAWLSLTFSVFLELQLYPVWRRA